MARQEPALGNRVLVEEAVALMLAELPAGWVSLRLRVRPTAQPPAGEAVVETASGEQILVVVPPQVLALLAEHQNRAVAAGAPPWQQMAIECHADGRLSASTLPGSVETSARSGTRVMTRALAAFTLGLLIASAAVFAWGWRWGPLPRAEMISLPPVPPREKEAFGVVVQWFDAENRGDVPGMAAVTCAHPSQSVQDWISSTESFGQVESYVFPDAAIDFRDDGDKVWVKVAVRLRPISDKQRQWVESVQKKGGFFFDELTLTDQGGALKVCDITLRTE